jgi:hypothetical protein
VDEDDDDNNNNDDDNNNNNNEDNDDEIQEVEVDISRNVSFNKRSGKFRTY